MSETTSESGQAHLADEPSMEDILDSIRKIIADDDQTMDIAPPQALDIETSEENIAEIDPSMSPSSPVSASNPVSDSVLGPSAEYDENSVFNTVRGEKSRHDAVEDPDETVDLDIEALLSGAETTPETVENLSAQDFSDDDDLPDMLDIEIPEQEEEVSVAVEEVSVAVSDEAVEGEASPTDILDLADIVEDSEPNYALEDSEDDNLFDELEGLLAEDSDDVIPSFEGESSSESKPEEIEAQQPQAISEPEPSAATDAPAFHSDEADMDMVKSLMADLTEPETETSGTDLENTSETAPIADLSQETSPEQSSETEEDIRDIDDIMDEVLQETASSRPTSENVSVSEPSPDIDAPLSESEASSEDEFEDEEFDDSDIFDEIINMSLEDEIGETESDQDLQIPEPAQEESESAASGDLEAESPASSPEEDETDSENRVTAQSLISSLMEIAGAAEQDAEEAEAELSAAPSATEQDDETLDPPKNITEEIPSTEVVDTSPPNNPVKETADMPKAAVNQDRILDDVTGEAASSAFASLNNMVEEKAIQAERGDRIGDLVMDALRPMLKEWLDEHLNDIVERAVTKEVQRISSGK